MRYLILSDIHANLTALDTALAATKGKWEKAVCLGDVVGYGPDPNEVIDRIREIEAITIRGNHDKAGSGLANAEDFNPVARNAALWTRDKLRPELREYLEKLPTGRQRLTALPSFTGRRAMRMNTCSLRHKPSIA